MNAVGQLPLTGKRGEEGVGFFDSPIDLRLLDTAFAGQQHPHEACQAGLVDMGIAGQSALRRDVCHPVAPQPAGILPLGQGHGIRLMAGRTYLSPVNR